MPKKKKEPAIEAVVAVPEPPKPELSVEDRYERASVYKKLLASTIVEGDGAHEAFVENEVKEFIRSRFEILLGAKEDPTARDGYEHTLKAIYSEIRKIGSIFSKDQALALQSLADATLKVKGATSAESTPAVHSPLDNPPKKEDNITLKPIPGKIRPSQNGPKPKQQPNSHQMEILANQELHERERMNDRHTQMLVKDRNSEGVFADRQG